MEGHAGFNPGNDIVCAGCSALAFALLGWLANFHPEHAEARSDGYLEISVLGVSPELEGAWGLAEIGFEQISAAHPKFVRVEKNFFDFPADNRGGA